MSDKRSFPRSVVDLTVHVRIKRKWIEATIIDLTVEEISLEIDVALEKDTTATMEIKENLKVKRNELQIKIIRCLAIKGERNKHSIVAQFIEPNDEFLMDVLALVHGKGQKQDRRGTIYGR